MPGILGGVAGGANLGLLGKAVGGLMGGSNIPNPPGAQVAGGGTCPTCGQPTGGRKLGPQTLPSLIGSMK